MCEVVERSDHHSGDDLVQCFIQTLFSGCSPRCELTPPSALRMKLTQGEWGEGVMSGNERVFCWGGWGAGTLITLLNSGFYSLTPNRDFTEEVAEKT